MDVKSKKRFASKVSKTTNKPGFSDNHSVTSEKLIHNESMRSENTYQLHPEDDKKFKSYVVEGEMRRILSETLDRVDYKDSMGSALTTDLANDIKKAIQGLGWPRYKYVVQVVLGQNKNQSVQVGSRCLLDQAADSFACTSYKTKTIFAVAACFGVYFD